MASQTPARQRNGKTYQLTVLAEDLGSTTTRYFDTLEELAHAAGDHRTGYTDHWLYYRGWALKGYVRRQGPVEGISKWRGGRRDSNVRVQALRRQSAGWLPEEGEPAPRPCHVGTALPSSWDGRNRCREDNWKSQHKGRKAWDRA